MHKLVFIENSKTVTDSLTIALVFIKDHKRVMQDIRELECSEEFRQHHFVLSSYKSAQNKDVPKYIITQNGFSLLVMGYTGSKAMEFKEKYISEFDRMKSKLTASVDVTGLSPILQQLIQGEQRQRELEARQLDTEQQLTTIKETFLQRDENWRSKMNGLLNGAANRMGGHQVVKRESYRLLEERAKCNLSKRLTNLHERLADSGATKTKIKDTNRLDVIESEPRLKEIYTTIVKELAIGTLA